VKSIAWLALAASAPAFAGEPLATEDASVLERGVCQAELWHRWSTNGAHEGWLVPACSVGDALELGVGYARTRDADAGGHSRFLLQAKGVAWRSADDRWSAGAIAAALRDGAHESRGSALHEAYAAGLVSFNALDNALRVHLNTGVAWRRSDYTTGVYGAAVEYDLRDDWTLMAEVFRDEPGRAKFQLGVRYALVTDRVELFASGGDRFGGGDGWFAKFGVRFQSWRLF
jgi:hypothetical protein